MMNSHPYRGGRVLLPLIWVRAKYFFSVNPFSNTHPVNYLGSGTSQPQRNSSDTRSGGSRGALISQIKLLISIQMKKWISKLVVDGELHPHLVWGTGSVCYLYGEFADSAE